LFEVWRLQSSRRDELERRAAGSKRRAAPVSLAAPIGDDQDGQLGDLIEDAERFRRSRKPRRPCCATRSQRARLAVSARSRIIALWFT
jgi:DNA-directed RNA polymerase sigma subunit (sigma70/sigma32)